MGIRFHQQIEAIKSERMKKGISCYPVSTEKITNLIVRHKAWPELFKDITSIPEEEVHSYGL